MMSTNGRGGRNWRGRAVGTGLEWWRQVGRKEVVASRQTAGRHAARAKLSGPRSGAKNVATGITPNASRASIGRTRLSARACPAPESDEHHFMQSVPYDSLVGSLSYIAVAVRPEIARAIHTLQRAQAHLTRAYWYAALRILQYLRSTPTLGPKYSTLAGSQSQLQVHAYVDASFEPD